jgi:DNA anti-recombination protein RmuC
MMRRREILLIGLTVLAVGAGVVAGMVVSRLPSASAAPTTSALTEQLKLSPQQSDQMKQIWEGVRDKVRTSYEGADRLQRQRDEAIMAMLSTEQKAQFERLTRDFADRFETLRRDRDDSFHQAVEQTRKLLAEEQRRKYDDLLKALVRADELGAATTPAATQVH